MMRHVIRDILDKHSKWLLVALHGLFSVASLVISLMWFPPQSLLYSWWFAPLDCFVLVGLTPLLAFDRTVALAWVCGGSITSLQLLALGFLAWQSGQLLVPSFALTILYVMRIIVGRLRVAALLPPAVVRRCSS